MMERDGKCKNILNRPKRPKHLKKFMQTRMKTKKNPENPTPYPFIYHFSRKRYPFRIPSISDKWCHFHIPCLELCIPSVFFFLHRNQSQKQLVHRRCFIFLLVPAPLHWRSINPLQLIFYHPRSTDFEEEIEGL